MGIISKVILLISKTTIFVFQIAALSTHLKKHTSSIGKLLIEI